MKCVEYKSILYLGAILLLFMISRSFNSLKVLTINNTKTMREAHYSFKVNDLALQIKESINNMPKEKVLRGNKIREIDEYLIRYEQQIEGRKLLSFDSIKKEWDRIKIMPFFDHSEMIRGLERLHREVNRKVLDDIEKREAINEKDISHLKRPFKNPKNRKYSINYFPYFHRHATRHNSK